MSIGSRAFYNCTNVNRVIKPSSITNIGKSAFIGTILINIIIGVNISLDDSVINSVFVLLYNNNGKLAGTYTRPDNSSSVWTLSNNSS